MAGQTQLYPNLNNGNEMQNQADRNKDGGVQLDELQRLYPGESPGVIREEFVQADVNQDGQLDRQEYAALMRSRALRFAKLIVVPKRARIPSGVDRTDGKYEESYSCMPPPIFMLTITLIELGIFTYHTHEIVAEKGWIGINGPAPIDSVLIYNPYRRHEAWRFLTYMLVHSGWMHIVNNVIMQLFLGILLEMVHKWWRVLLVYFAGVIAGSLITSISDPNYYLAGASGGVYALITAHMATVIMNWNDMEMPWARVICFLGFCILDVGTALYYRYIADIHNNVGYMAHLGGAIAGLLIGIKVLKNFDWKRWETILWWVNLAIVIILLAAAILWNILAPQGFYPPSRH